MDRTNSEIVGWSAGICGALGLVAGLIVGLFAYVPTAWAAAFEIGIPAAAAGAVLGLGIVGLRTVVRWVRARFA